MGLQSSCNLERLKMVYSLKQTWFETELYCFPLLEKRIIEWEEHGFWSWKALFGSPVHH